MTTDNWRRSEKVQAALDMRRRLQARFPRLTWRTWVDERAGGTLCATGQLPYVTRPGRKVSYKVSYLEWSRPGSLAADHMIWRLERKLGPRWTGGGHEGEQRGGRGSRGHNAARA